VNEGIGFINKNMFGAQRRMHTTSRKGLGQFRNWERSASKGSLFHPAGTALKSSSAGSISVPALVIGTAQRSVNFARLAPGSYRFLVRAVNTEGVSSPQPATLEFTVTEPLWAQWWFLAAVALAAVTGDINDARRVWLVSDSAAGHRWQQRRTSNLQLLESVGYRPVWSWSGPFTRIDELRQSGG